MKKCRGGGDSAYGAEGCGIAPWAMSIKSALRDLLSVSYGMISILVISRYAAPPYPAAPDFPPSGRQNKTPQNILFISISTVSTGCCATSKRRKGGGVSHQRGNLHHPPGRLSRFYHKRAPSINVRRPPQPSAAKPLSNLRTLGAIAPSNFRTLKPHRGLSIRRVNLREYWKAPPFEPCEFL